jgi:hypothetical protein
MNPDDASQGPSGLHEPAQNRQPQDATQHDELRLLLLRSGASLRHPLTEVHNAVRDYRLVPSQAGVRAEWRREAVSLLEDAATQYHALRQQVAQLPLAAFNGRRDLRAELLTSLSLIERGLSQLAAGTSVLGTTTATARLEQAANALRTGHTLGIKVSNALGLPT